MMQRADVIAVVAGGRIVKTALGVRGAVCGRGLGSAVRLLVDKQLLAAASVVDRAGGGGGGNAADTYGGAVDGAVRRRPPLSCGEGAGTYAAATPGRLRAPCFVRRAIVHACTVEVASSIS